jgi:hypothetical protein
VISRKICGDNCKMETSEMDRTGSGSYPVCGFDVSCFEYSGFTIVEFVIVINFLLYKRICPSYSNFILLQMSVPKND